MWCSIRVRNSGNRGGCWPPPHSEAFLPINTVLRLYRERMQVEQSFRDFKTHLGLRGLRA